MSRGQVVVSMQARTDHEGGARHRRSTAGQPSDRTAESHRQGTPGGVAEQPEGRLLHREVQQVGHGGPARASRGRNSDAGYRQALRVERHRRRSPLHGRRTCPRKGRHHRVRRKQAEVPFGAVTPPHCTAARGRWAHGCMMFRVAQEVVVTGCLPIHSSPAHALGQGTHQA